MCDHDDIPLAPLTFAQFVNLLQQPPFEPCESELEYLTPAEYDEAFREVDRLYRHKLIRYIARIMADQSVAEDLTQQVLTSVYRARSSFDKSYLYRAAKNAALTELKRTKQRHILEARWAGVRRYGDKGKAEAREKRPPLDAEQIERTREEAVGREVERLPEKFRVPLLLLTKGESYARIMGITRANEGTVRARICRGKMLMRRRLRDYLKEQST
jgi:RNA polymerase sigma-70 factor (ECF subfamily)